MEFDVELIFVPLIVFVVLVLPIWIVLHYLTVWKRERRARNDERHHQGEMNAVATGLEERLDAIESILDTDAPDWRKKV